MIESFYFGKHPNLLFGAYHPPQDSAARDAGVVLCYPMGQEYIRWHTFFRRLADLLCRQGFHVLRFDFHSCGDSEGACEQARIEQWTADVSTAVHELRSGCDIDRICLVGLRLGASLSIMAGAQRGDIDGMVLWNPIVTGEAYLRELTALHREWQRGSFAKPQGKPAGDQQREVLGFPLTDSMHRDLMNLDLLSVRRKPADDIVVLDSGGAPGIRSVCDCLNGTGASVRYEYIPGPRVWVAKDDEMGRGLVPAEALSFIVLWISGAFS
jgi:pimeloyl-ACP methyl ester carboxylesterase